MGLKNYACGAESPAGLECLPLGRPLAFGPAKAGHSSFYVSGKFRKFKSSMVFGFLKIRGEKLKQGRSKIPMNTRKRMKKPE